MRVSGRAGRGVNHRRLGCLLALSLAVGACAKSEVSSDAGDARGSTDLRLTSDTIDAGETRPGRDTGGRGEVATENDAGDDAGEAAADASPNSDTVRDVKVMDVPGDPSPKPDIADVAPETAPGADASDGPADMGSKPDVGDVAQDIVVTPDTSDGAGDMGSDTGVVTDTSDAGAIDVASEGENRDIGTGDAAADVPAEGPAPGIVVATHQLAVDNKGTVFNVADDYFNDGFIPATTIANFGLHAQIIAVPNADGSLDVAWLDYATGKSAPWALPAPAPINITHIDATLATATTAGSGISSYKLLGFTRDPAGNFYLAYNKDHPFKSTTVGDQNRLNGNELHVTRLNGGIPAWDQIVFGDQDNNNEATLGDPGGAASGVLGFDPTNNRLVMYLGHSMMWFGEDGSHIRHQAGFFRLFNPDSGAVIPPSGNDVIHFGAGWFYSHNFNQRLIVDGGNYYVLAHGDAYPRQLGIARWSVSGYTTKNSPDFDESYWTVTGALGDNKTDAQTGQFVRMSDGRFLIVHTSAQGRSARDVRLVFSDGATGKAASSTAVWLTSNQGTLQATMPKVERLGTDVLVTYALWDSTVKHQLTWYAAVLDQALNVIAAPRTLANVEFVDSAPLFRFAGGPNAGRVGWVSGNAAHTLSVHVASRAPQ